MTFLLVQEGYVYVSDVVLSQLVHEHDVVYVDLSAQCSVRLFQEVYICKQIDLRLSSFIDVQCIQIGISDCHLEAVRSVLAFRSEGHGTAEHEVEIRIVACDPSVEEVVVQLSCSHDALIVISVDMQPVYLHAADVQ